VIDRRMVSTEILPLCFGEDSSPGCKPAPRARNTKPTASMEPLSLAQLEGSSNNTIPLSETQTPAAPKPASQRATSADADSKPRRTRQRWTKEETDDLIKGCATWGVGNWKRYRINLPLIRVANGLGSLGTLT